VRDSNPDPLRVMDSGEVAAVRLRAVSPADMGSGVRPRPMLVGGLTDQFGSPPGSPRGMPTRSIDCSGSVRVRQASDYAAAQ
jgi:hypothetical protein